MAGFIEQSFKEPQTVLERWEFKKPFRLATYAASDLPDPALHTGCLVYVSDGPVSNKVRYSDGSSWITLG